MSTIFNTKLERAPLLFALTQIRFSPVLTMESYVPKIQEDLRQLGYTRFEKEAIQQINFTLSTPEPAMTRSMRWLFYSRDKKRGVILSSDFIVFECAEYEGLEAFLRMTKDVLTVIINANLKIEFTQQIGLRYVDLIRPIDSKNVNDLINPNLRGISANDFGAQSSKYVFVIEAATSLGSLFIRSIETGDETGKSNSVLPPDLFTSKLEFSLEGNIVASRILDFDHVSRNEEDFTAEAIIKKINELHKIIKRAFCASVTQEAMDIWSRKG